MMSALSPGPYLFWSLVLGPLIISTWRENPVDGLAIVGSFYVAMIAMNIAFVLLFGQAARFGNQVRKTMLGWSVIALVLFGCFQLWQGLVQ